MLHIRGFQGEDSDKLLSIASEAFADEIVRGMGDFPVDYFERWLKRRGSKVLVAEEDSIIIGFLAMTEATTEAPAQIHIMAVDKVSRGRGIGRMLVWEALEHARSTQASKVKLGTRPWNIGMQKVCVSLGFIPEAYMRREYLGEDLIWYAYFL